MEVTITVEEFGKALDQKISYLKPFGPKSKRGWYFTFGADIHPVAYEYLKDKVEVWDGKKDFDNVKVYKGGKIPVYFSNLEECIPHRLGWDIIPYDFLIKD